MEIINTKRASKITINHRISETCGGRFTKSEALRIGGIGVGGILYKNGIDLIDEDKSSPKLYANIETLKNGLLVYTRSEVKNYLILIPYDEILNINVVKKMDEIKLEGFSFFKFLMKKGLPYHYSKIFLLDKEYTELHKTYINISTTSLEVINLEVRRHNYLKILDYFEKLPLEDKVMNEIESYTIVDELAGDI